MGKQFQGSNPQYNRGRESNQPHLSSNNNRAEDLIKSDQVRKWIKEGVDKETIQFADDFGKKITKLTTSQIRTVFGELRRIQISDYEKEKTAFILIKPKLAYAVKRHQNEGLTAFYELFKVAYDAVDTSTDSNKQGAVQFKNLMNLMEAVLAYHKFHGGRD